MSTAMKSRGAQMLESLENGLDCRRDCHWPGKPEFLLTMVPLSCGEMQEANAGAENRFKNLGTELNLFTSDDFSSELHIQVLARSIRDPSDTAVRLFSDAEDLRNRITPDERTLLTDEFIELQAESNPLPEEMPEELFQEIDSLVKKKAETQLRSIGSRTLTRYLLSMESQPSS